MREYYDLQLNELNNQIIEMGSLVEKSVAYSTKALVECEIEKLEKLPKYEKAVNKRRRKLRGCV